MTTAKELIETIIEGTIDPEVDKAIKKAGLKLGRVSGKGDELEVGLRQGSDSMQVTMYLDTKEFTCDDLENEDLSDEASMALKSFADSLERMGWYLV